MEAYVAEGGPPLDRCLADVRRCDIYIGLFAWRYGFRPPDALSSMTELEYREAVKEKKACYIFLLAEDAPWPMTLVDRGEDGDRIAALRDELVKKHVCSFFTGPDDLDAKVTAALANHRTGARDQETLPNHELVEHLTEASRSAYLARLRQQYQGIELDALTPPPSIDYLSVGLTSIFVEPSVREDAPPEVPRAWWQRMRSDDEPSAVEVPDRQQALLLRESYESKARERLFEVVTDPEHRLLVIMGDPGSGKSAVTRFLALALADETPDPRLAGLHGYLPVLIELRSYLAYAGDDRGTKFLDYLDHRATSDALGLPRDELEAYLRGGGPALFLFDGLDEILDPQRRADAAGQIAAFATQYHDVRVLVTSRIIGYNRWTLTTAGFDHFTLDDLDKEQIDQFLHGWYKLTMADQEPEAEVQRARIRAAISSSAAIRELAGNPLLLTILAVMARNQELPKERWNLYEHAADVLIFHWDVDWRMREHHTDYEPLDDDARKALLQHLALWMQSREGGLAGNYIVRADLVRIFEDCLIDRYQYDRGKASAIANTIIDQFRERNFILGRYGQRVFGFVHRTFLEFFCAQAIVERHEHSDPEWTVERLRGLFAEHWAEPSWREVLRLIVGALPARPAGDLIEMLATEVNRPWPPEEFTQPPWNLALAAQCVAEVADVRAIDSAARTVIIQLILLIEHGISIEDRTTVELAEAEILPAIRVVGERWPGREAFIFWFRRRGIRVSWTTGSSFATRIAALLATAQEGIEDLLEEELGNTADRRARHALVAGLAEVAALPGITDRPAGANRRARCRTLLITRATSDQHGTVRLAALEALVANFGADPHTSQLLIDQAGDDPYPELRLMAVHTLGGQPDLTEPIRSFLLDRAGADPDEPVRRAAVEALGRHCADLPEVEELLMGRLRADPDAGVLQAAAHALIDGFSATDDVRALLMLRVDAEPTDPVRRCLLRLLGESFPDDLVRDLLADTLQDDSDPGCRSVALHGLIRLYGTGDALHDVLVDRAEYDDDGGLRLTAVRALTERYGPDRPLLTRMAGIDDDATIRVFALRMLAEHFPDGDTATLLVHRAGDDDAAGTRLVATELLAEHFASDARSREVILKQSRLEVDTVVRLAATRALIRLVANPLIHQSLLDRIDTDNDPQIIREAAVALATWSPPGTVQPHLVERARNDDYAGVRLAAAETLVTQFGPNSLVNLLLDLAAKDPDPVVFRTAVEALMPGLCDELTLAALLMDRAVEGDPAIRRPACQLLGTHFGDDPQVRLLLIDRAQRDPDIGVRRAAVAELGAVPVQHSEVRALLVTMIDDPDWSVRRSAVHALGCHFGADEDTRTLFVERARNSPDPDTRRIFAQALTWLPNADPADLPDA